MIIECACKKYKFAVKAEEIGINGRVVQCGVCDQKWFQEPASSEEFKTLKENFVKEEEKKEASKDQKTIKEKPSKSYVAVSFENKEFILNKNPKFADFFSLLEEFIEYIKMNYSEIIQAFIPKQK
jgi:predicted Zn finger-like uncharacterized protein